MNSEVTNIRTKDLVEAWSEGGVENVPPLLVSTTLRGLDTDELHRLLGSSAPSLAFRIAGELIERQMDRA